jgi:hypothetical protein
VKEYVLRVWVWSPLLPSGQVGRSPDTPNRQTVTLTLSHSQRSCTRYYDTAVPLDVQYSVSKGPSEVGSGLVADLLPMRWKTALHA